MIQGVSDEPVLYFYPDDLWYEDWRVVPNHIDGHATIWIPACGFMARATGAVEFYFSLPAPPDVGKDYTYIWFTNIRLRINPMFFGSFAYARVYALSSQRPTSNSDWDPDIVYLDPRGDDHVVVRDDYVLHTVRHYNVMTVPGGEVPKVAFLVAGIVHLIYGSGELAIGAGLYDAWDTAEPPNQRGVRYLAFPGTTSCWISTAVCHALGKGDSCAELDLLRNFRDTYVRASPGGERLISQYYEQAPKVLAGIYTSPDPDQTLRDIHDRYLQPCLNLISRPDYEAALATYTQMYLGLAKKYSRTIS